VPLPRLLYEWFENQRGKNAAVDAIACFARLLVRFESGAWFLAARSDGRPRKSYVTARRERVNATVTRGSAEFSIETTQEWLHAPASTLTTRR
jgi:hypothetical protein